MDVGEWLRGLGLGEYEGKFRDNRIDADVLADLTDGDLEKLGLPLGDRKRVLKAIAGLVGLPSAGTKSEPADVHPPRPPSAERRPITVMFCDLVGSTSLAVAARRGGLAQRRQRLSRRSLGFGDRLRRARSQKARRRAHRRFSAIRGRRRTMPSARCGRRSPIQRSLAEINARNAGKGAPELSARIGLEFGPVVVDEGGEVFGEHAERRARGCRRSPSRARFS